MAEEKKNRIVLGLDVSTRCIGSTVASIDEDGNVKVLEISHLRLKIPGKIKGTEGLFMKSEQFKQKLREKYLNYYITDVIIEEPLIGSNNSQTAATLMRFNGMISQSVKDVLDVIPEYISSYDARKYGCPELMAVRKYDKKGETYAYKKLRSSVRKGETVLFGAYPFDCAKKLILWNYVSSKFPGIQWEYDKKGELKDENFDASDSLMCVLGYVSMKKYGDTEPKIMSFHEHIEGNTATIDYTVAFCGQTFDKTLEVEVQ